MRFIFLCLISSSLFSNQLATYIYEKATAGNVSQTVWTLTEPKNAILTLIAKNKEFTAKIKTDENFNIIKYTYTATDGQNKYKFRQEGNLIRAEGLFDGRWRNQSLRIGNKLWVQDFSFSLKAFIDSTYTQYHFSVINPSDLTLVEMIAKKETTAVITIGDKEYEAIKINLNLPGFKGMFWSGELWYDLKEKNMLIFKANNGPNTPITTITFFQKK